MNVTVECLAALRAAHEALALLVGDTRPIGPTEPSERMIPAQHCAGDLRLARQALIAAERVIASGGAE